MGSLYSKGVRKISRLGVSEKLESAVAKELDDQKLRYKPESLDLLVSQTKFSKCELKYIYQSFKQNCPSGFVSDDQFVQIFKTFFSIHRMSDASQYARLVFSTFDGDNNGRISFSEFANELSMFIKGTLDQRLEWLFNLYDTAKKGFITEDDYLRVYRAMYCLVGIHYYKDKQIPIVLRRHIRHQFVKLDKNRNGKITREDFVEGCLADTQIIESLKSLETVW